MATFRPCHGNAILKAINREHELTTKTLARVKFLLSGIFVSAVNAGLCDVNPITEVELPDGRAEGRITGAYELREILGMLEMPCFSLEARAAIGVAGFAGLRESEMAALCWADYDGSDIHVRHSRDRVSKELLSTKTEKSKAAFQ